VSHPSDREDTTWYKRGDVAIEVEDTAVGREISLYERWEGEWKRQFTMPATVAREYFILFDEIFPEE
jgi:hypothetical protein